eukprot:493018_1
MPEQRARRFRKARELLGSDAEQKDQTACRISPGTQFMTRLCENLRTFVEERKKSIWSKINVILSDAFDPGEGEHKIMKFIRAARELPSYDPNTRHCLYGKDADLYML